MAERLQKIISTAGIASRRDAEELIEQGRVTVNGKRAVLGDKADPAVDDVRVDGERVTITGERVYIMLNKPRQVVSTVHGQSQDDRDTVRDLVPVEGHLYPVGRLDADSEGLVLLTNDGEVAQRLTHPRYRHAKIYQVTVHGHMRDDVLDIWRRGVVLDDGRTAPAEIKVMRREPRFTQLQVTMHEGRKRQIRRIGSTLGFPVESIVRTHLATLELGDLKPGEWRYLTEAEIRALRASAMSGAAVERPPRREGYARRQREAGDRQDRAAYKRGAPGRGDRGRPRRDREDAGSGRGEQRARGPRPAMRRESFGQRDQSQGRDSGPREGQERGRDSFAGGARPARRSEQGRAQGQDRGRSWGSERRDAGAKEKERAPRDTRGRGPARRPFHERSGTGAENQERREPRPDRANRPERSSRSPRPEAAQAQGERRRGPSRPPRGARSGPPRRDAGQGRRTGPGDRSGQGQRKGGRAGGGAGGRTGGQSGPRGPNRGGGSGGRGPRRGGR